MSVRALIQRMRPEIVAMNAYSSARSLYKGRRDMVFLDANECAFPSYIGAGPWGRYPDQQPQALMDALCRLYDVSSRNLMISRGADEAIDIAMRLFCTAGRDNIVICPPTFPMYAQSATLQGASVKAVPLKPDFSLDVAGIEAAADENTKIIFLCSPNNPTGTLVAQDDVEKLCAFFAGKALVVVDETYIEYATARSLIPLCDRYENLMILRTLSKAYAAAGLRCGVAIGHADVMAVMTKVLAPYPLPQPVAQEALAILAAGNLQRLEGLRAQTIALRADVADRLRALPEVVEVFPSEANFLLVRVKDAADFTARCTAGDVIIRNQSHQPNLDNCVRIAIGSADDMDRLFAALAGQADSRAGHRTAHVTRRTAETAIDVHVDLDATGPIEIDTGVGFYDHMLEQIARHGGFSLKLSCAGDLHVDNHHTIEDCAIALGTALRQALGDKRGIGRYGFVLPMDEARAEAALDLSGRYYLDFQANFPDRMVGDMPVDLVEHVFRSLAENMHMTLHLKVTGENTHHMVEGCFKAFARALRSAIARQGDVLPSSKGML